MVLSETSYILPVPEYPHSFMFCNNCSYDGRCELRLLELIHVRHDFAFLPIILPHWQYLYVFIFLCFTFFPEKVDNVALQLGQTICKFSILLSVLTPFMWSRIKLMRLPHQVSFCPHNSHIGCFKFSLYSLLFKLFVDLYFEFSTKTNSVGILRVTISILIFGCPTKART